MLLKQRLLPGRDATETPAHRVYHGSPHNGTDVERVDAFVNRLAEKESGLHALLLRQRTLQKKGKDVGTEGESNWESPLGKMEPEPQQLEMSVLDLQE